MHCIFLHGDSNVIIVKEIQWELTEKTLRPPPPHTPTHIRTHIHTRIREQPWKSPSWTGLKFLTLKKGSSHFLTTFKVIKLKKNSINFLRLFEFLTEKGHHHCLKVFNTEKGLRHFLTTLKIFNIEKGHSSLPWVS